jgi:radical SAM protein with 4Fe4S-binding SPASM domain
MSGVRILPVSTVKSFEIAYEKLPLLRLRLHVTRECNLNCKHCYIGAAPGARLPDELNTKEVKDVIDQAYELGLLNITFTGGEPFLRNDIMDLLRYAYDNDIFVRVNTNGTIVDKQSAKELAEYADRLHLSVSLDGATEETHEYIRGRGTFTTVVNNLRFLASEGVSIVITTTLSRQNVHQIPEIVKLAKEIGAVGLRFPTLCGVGRALKIEQDVLTSRELLTATHTISRLMTTQGYNFAISADVPPAFFLPEVWEDNRYAFMQSSCLVGVIRMDVLSNGDVYACDSLLFPQYFVGNTRNQKLKEMWFGSLVLQKLRRLSLELPSRLKGVCAKCLLKEVCKGHCRATALRVYNDWFAPNPHCQDLYDIGSFPKQYIVD